MATAGGHQPRGTGRFTLTKDSDFKSLVRRRMSATGEAYTAARAAIYRPPDEPALPLARRAFGLKTVYRTYSAAGRPASDVTDALFRRVTARGLATNIFLENGARLRVVETVADGPQPAYSTPECDSLVDLVAQEQAGDQIHLRLADRADTVALDEGQPLEIALERPEAGQTEYYLVSAAISSERYLALLEPFSPPAGSTPASSLAQVRPPA